MSQPFGSLIAVAIEPKSSADREKLASALATLAQDAALYISIDKESGQTLLGGATERQLELAIHRLLHEFAVGIGIGAPQIAYREALTRAVEIDHTYRKQLGATGEFARVKILFEPAEVGTGLGFNTDVVGGAVPDEFVPYIKRGLARACEAGVLAFCPLDVSATLRDGAYHEVDSSGHAFEIAATAAVRQLTERKAVTLLEPVMTLQLTTPDEFLGGVIGDINSRRGRVEGARDEADRQVITAEVPLASMLGYENAVRALTRGQASHTMSFCRYERVPVVPDDDPSRFPPAIGMRA